MQPFSTSADKTLTALRPDSTDNARTPARAAGAEPDGAPFGAVFQASSERPARSGPVELTTVKMAKTADDTGAERPDSKGEHPESGRAVDTTPQAPRDLATGPAPGEHAERPSGEKATRPSTPADPPSTETRPVEHLRSDVTAPDDPIAAVTAPNRAGPTRITAAEGYPSGHDIDNVFANDAVAASLETGGNRTQHGTSASDAAPPRRGTAPDRQPPAAPAQPLVGPAPATSGRATGTAQAAKLSLASNIGGPRTGDRGAEAAGWRMPMTRGRDDARLSPLTGAPVLAHTASPPVKQGGGADAIHPKTTLSPAQFVTFGDRAGGEGAERGADPDAPLGVEKRGTSGSGSGTGSPTLATLSRSELPQAIAMQIAAAIQKGGPGMKPGIELMLSPEELGRVRLTFTQSETGVTVNVHADRAETLELLRRNIDTLAQEFIDIGYESAEFTFERRDTEARDAARSADMDDTDGASGVTQGAPDAVTPILLVSDRLDIRL